MGFWLRHEVNPEHFIEPHELLEAPHSGELIENDEIKKKRLGMFCYRLHPSRASICKP